MLKRLVLLATLLLTTLSCSLFTDGLKATSQPEATSDLDREKAEYEVYSALIEGKFSMEALQQVVIKDQTDIFSTLGESQDTQDRLRKELPGLKKETLEDFVTRSAENIPLKAESFDLSKPVKLLSESEVNSFFNSTDTNGWDSFYTQYPDSQGLLTLSRVGFDKNQEQALVYYGNMSHWLAGAGFYVLLVKTNGEWQIKKETMAWIS